MATHQGADGTWSISSRQMWLPGIYDTETTARAAFRLDNRTLQALTDRICAIDGENRPITKEDLRRDRRGLDDVDDLPPAG